MLEELPGRPGPIVGRDAQLSRLAALVDAALVDALAVAGPLGAGPLDAAPAQGQVLLVLGDPGMGKSLLLANAADRAGSAGLRVLRATGRESEASLAFAGLHQLLRPVIGAVTDLPPRQAQALLGALGLAADPAAVVPAAADQLVTGIAVLTLLSDVAETAPVLLVIDDAHWLDRSSLAALAFVGSRLDTERVSLLLGARGQVPPPGFDRGFPELRLEPLRPADAATLLDSLPRPPRGRARAQVLAQAAGNPMALIELARVIAADPAAGRRWAEEPLPPGDRLAAVIIARYAALPAPVRAALLLAAVADGTDLAGAASGVTGLDAHALASAEQLGLVTIGRAGLRFAHPLIRSAIYHAAPFAQRAAAHRRLAAALDHQPDRRAWHLAAAALHPDEQVASLLEASAADARRRGGAAAAALALERAAELSPAPRDQARRLAAAASAAVTAGQGDWVENLAARALAVATDPELRLRARSAAGWALAYAGRPSAAFTALISVAEEASADLPALAWEALADAATVAYQAGTPASREAVSHVLRLVEERNPPAAADGPDPRIDQTDPTEANPQKLWILACTTPSGTTPSGTTPSGTTPSGTGPLVPYLRRVARTPLDEAALWRIGSAAWLLDESELAVRLLRSAMDRLRAPGMRGASGGGLTALGWLYIDTGRWDQALEAAAEAADLAEANQMGMVAAAADAITATVAALRGDSGTARKHAERALARVDPAESGLIAARAWRALGVAALADGDYFLAFTHLGRLFSADGVPVHNVFSYLGVADLAAAAVRADRRSEGQALLERVLGDRDRTASPRLRQLIARARGILADPAGPDAHFAAALGDPAGDQWPFERAQLRLDYAEWLRRRRRINEAKPDLALALETFRRLRARSLVDRAEAELRASGIAVASGPAAPDPLAELTPQQRQIVRLAGDGLTNREIGDRLLLSPRTVGSHLYRSFPKLGITGRHQLRDVIARSDT